MPRPANPSIPEFYVYALEARAVPFYIGIGRSSRASDRVRYVRYLMKRSISGDTVRWAASNRVVAELLQHGEQVTVARLHEKLTRDQALAHEGQEIRQLLKAGYVLANRQQNNSPTCVENVVRFVLARGRKKDTMPKAAGTINWLDLNKLLLSTEDENLIRELLDTERKGPNRPNWVLRIHQRLIACVDFVNRENSRPLPVEAGKTNPHHGTKDYPCQLKGNRLKRLTRIPRSPKYSTDPFTTQSS